jgi:predicted PurR-regulated permease PerM
LALDPLTVAVQRRFGTRRGVAVAVVAAGVVLVAGLLIAVLGPRAVDQARQFSDELPATLDELEELPLVGGWLRGNEFADRAQEWIRELPEEFTDERVGETASTLVSGLAGVAIVVVVTLAVLIDGEYLLARFRRLLPSQQQERADEIGRVMYSTLGRYFGGSITVAVMMGLFVLAVGLLLSVPLAPLAAIWAMLTDLIPQVGGFLGGSFFVLLAITASPLTAVVAGGLFVVYMNIENHIIQPAIVGRSVDLLAPTTMVAAFVGGALAGVPGALVATPLVGAAKAIYLEARGIERTTPDARIRLIDRVRGLARRRT